MRAGLAAGGDRISYDDSLALHPPFSLFGCAEKRKRAVHGPKEKRRWGENLTGGQVSPCARVVPARFGCGLESPCRRAPHPGPCRSLDPRVETADEAVGWLTDGLPSAFRASALAGRLGGDWFRCFYS